MQENVSTDQPEGTRKLCTSCDVLPPRGSLLLSWSCTSIEHDEEGGAHTQLLPSAIAIIRRGELTWLSEIKQILICGDDQKVFGL